MRQADKSIKQRKNHPKNETSQVTDIRHSEQKKPTAIRKSTLFVARVGHDPTTSGL